MTTQTKRLKDNLKKIGVKARVRTPFNRKHKGYENARAFVENLTEEQAQQLRELGCRIVEQHKWSSHIDGKEVGFWYVED